MKIYINFIMEIKSEMRPINVYILCPYHSVIICTTSKIRNIKCEERERNIYIGSYINYWPLRGLYKRSIPAIS